MVIGVIGRVILHLKLYYEHDYHRIVRQEVILAINCVNDKMRETLELNVTNKGTYASYQYTIS